MAKSQSPKPDDPKQFRRFVETAKTLEVDESGKAFKRVFEKVVPIKRKRKTQSS